jgi:hypothetical protein
MRGKVGVILGAVLLSAGCGSKDPLEGERPRVVPATGRVLYRGQPVEGAKVTFTNSAAGVSGYGETGPDGRFRLTTFKEGDGVVPGTQRVAVRKVEVIDRSKPGFDYSTSSEVPPPPEERWLIPRRYGNVATSGLTVEVAEGAKNDFVLELKD